MLSHMICQTNFLLFILFIFPFCPPIWRLLVNESCTQTKNKSDKPYFIFSLVFYKSPKVCPNTEPRCLSKQISFLLYCFMTYLFCCAFTICGALDLHSCRHVFLMTMTQNQVFFAHLTSYIINKYIENVDYLMALIVTHTHGFFFSITRCA